MSQNQEFNFHMNYEHKAECTIQRFHPTTNQYDSEILALDSFLQTLTC